MHSRPNCIEPDDERASDLSGDALALAGMGTWSCDLRTEALSWSPVVFDIFGLARHERFDRRDTVEMYAEPYQLMLDRLRSAAIAERGTFSLEAPIVRPNGVERWIRVRAATRVDKGHAVTLYGMKEDITLERGRWEQLRRSAEYDVLTGLANRAQFHDRFLDRAAGSDALTTLGALALFDLDNVREINRRWGIAAGDACLAALARRLLAAYPDTAFGARLGGSEFAMLLNADGRTRAYGSRAVPANLVDPVPWRDSVIPVQVSVGMVIPGRYRTFEAEALYAQATAALEAAKHKRGDALRVAVEPFNEKDYGHKALGQAGSAADIADFQLSSRETQVLRHIAQGYSTDQIAEAMAVSRHTVRNFIRRIYQKMDVGGRVDAVRLAVQHRML